MTALSVYGLGYVGLPTAALFANNGFSVYGVDTDVERLETLRTAGSDFRETELNAYVDRVLGTDALQLRERPTTSEYHLVCVPTPYDQDHGEADLSYVRAAVESIAPQLRPGDAVIVESTVPPGTTNGIVHEILEQKSGVPPEDFDVAFCPETVLPGSILEELQQNDRIVGGVDDRSTATAHELFDDVVAGEVHCAADATTAEFVKLAQNTFRDTNVALANELAKVARDYDVVPRPAFQLANKHPRVSLLRPGPGVGGHCLPVDPLYLGQDSDEVDLIARAREVNDEMVDYIRNVLADRLGILSGNTIAVFGLAYKGNVADIRNSPSKRLVESLTETPPMIATDGGDGPAEVRVHDPHVTEAPVELWDRSQAPEDADALVFMTGHDEFDELSPDEVATRMRGDLVVDAKGLTDSSWGDAGLTVERL